MHKINSFSVIYLSIKLVLYRDSIPEHAEIWHPYWLQNEQKLPKMVYIIPKVLVLHFGENFMKIQTKIAKLQMHENWHKYVNE